MNTKPESIILQEKHEQSGGGWEVIAVYGDGDEDDEDREQRQETLASFSPFLSEKLVQQIAGLIAKSQGLNEYKQEHE